MKRLHGLIASFILIAAFILSVATSFADEKKEAPKQFIPVLTYRTGPFQAGGSGAAGGFEDYMALINIKGGLNGVMLEFEEYDYGFNTARAVELYERVKSKKPCVVHPYSTGVTYALIERATEDRIPLLNVGYGRTDTSDGAVFPYIFNPPTNYFSLSTVKIRFIAEQEGGIEKLKGLKIANLHLDHPYGRETKPILEAMAKKFGFEVKHFPVSMPGIDQKSIWLNIRRFQPDWVINRNWGVSCTVPLREAARIGFPRDRILGVWWCGSEEDCIPAGPAAKGYLAASFTGVGRDFPLIQEIIQQVYGRMKGNLSLTRVGTAHYNRGVTHGIITCEAILTAQQKFGVRPITGEEMQWGLEHLDLTADKIKKLGAEGLMMPLKLTPKNHEGGGMARIVQWDGEEWVPITEWIEPFTEFVWGEIKKSSMGYAKQKGITPRKLD